MCLWLRNSWDSWVYIRSDCFRQDNATIYSDWLVGSFRFRKCCRGIRTLRVALHCCFDFSPVALYLGPLLGKQRDILSADKCILRACQLYCEQKIFSIGLHTCSLCKVSARFSQRSTWNSVIFVPHFQPITGWEEVKLIGCFRPANTVKNYIYLN